MTIADKMFSYLKSECSCNRERTIIMTDLLDDNLDT